MSSTRRRSIRGLVAASAALLLTGTALAPAAGAAPSANLVQKAKAVAPEALADFRAAKQEARSLRTTTVKEARVIYRTATAEERKTRNGAIRAAETRKEARTAVRAFLKETKIDRKAMKQSIRTLTASGMISDDSL